MEKLLILYIKLNKIYLGQSPCIFKIARAFLLDWKQSNKRGDVWDT